MEITGMGRLSEDKKKRKREMARVRDGEQRVRAGERVKNDR